MLHATDTLLVLRFLWRRYLDLVLLPVWPPPLELTRRHQRQKRRYGVATERGVHMVPSPSDKYRDRVCKNIETAEFYPTILKCPELGPDIYLSNGVG